MATKDFLVTIDSQGLTTHIFLPWLWCSYSTYPRASASMHAFSKRYSSRGRFKRRNKWYATVLNGNFGVIHYFCLSTSKTDSMECKLALPWRWILGIIPYHMSPSLGISNLSYKAMEIKIIWFYRFGLAGMQLRALCQIVCIEERKDQWE